MGMAEADTLPRYMPDRSRNLHLSFLQTLREGSRRSRGGAQPLTGGATWRPERSGGRTGGTQSPATSGGLLAPFGGLDIQVVELPTTVEIGPPYVFNYLSLVYKENRASRKPLQHKAF